MNILIISNTIDCPSLGFRLQGLDKNNKVYYYVIEKKNREKGSQKGIINFVDDYKNIINKMDLIIFEGNSNTDKIRKHLWSSFRNKKQIYNFAYSPKSIKIGGQEVKPYDFSIKLEKDRNWAHKLMEDLKIGNKTEHWRFTKIDEAIKFVSNNKSKYVVKVEALDMESDSTYVGICDDGEDVIKYLATYQFRENIKKLNAIDIEKKINGVEIAVSGIFNGKDWIYKQINFEHKKFLDTPYSFNTGEMGTVLKPIQEHKLFSETLDKLGNILSAIDYRGHIDINGILNENGYFPLEFTPRFGVPTYCLELESIKSNILEVLTSVASKSNYNLDVDYDNWVIGTVVCGEGYPFEDIDYKKMKLLPVIDLDKVINNFHMFDICKIGSDYYTTGGYVGVMVAKGKDICEARELLYNKLLMDIKIPKTYWRDDIGVKVKNEYLEKLTNLGYQIL